MFRRRPVRRQRDGTWKVELSDDERVLLSRVGAELSELLSDVTSEPDPDDPFGEQVPTELSNPVLMRLFPSASDDPEADAEYHRLMRSDLAERHRWALDTLVETAEATVLDDEQIEAWTAAVNQVRLVLGTAVGVSEDEPPDLDDDDPDAAQWAVYHYLTWLLDALIDARLPTVDPGR